MLSSTIALDRNEVEPTSITPEYLLGLRSSVASDGAGAYFDLSFTNQRPFRLLVPFPDMSAIFSEVRQAQALMASRQRMQLDKGASMLLELCETALRPRHLDTLVDPRNGDRLFVVQFDQHSPMAFRVSPVEFAAFMAGIQNALSRSMN